MTGCSEAASAFSRDWWETYASSRRHSHVSARLVGNVRPQAAPLGSRAAKVHMRCPFRAPVPNGREWQPGLREDHGND